jgi:hypothetical protein
LGTPKRQTAAFFSTDWPRARQISRSSSSKLINDTFVRRAIDRGEAAVVCLNDNPADVPCGFPITTRNGNHHHKKVLAGVAGTSRII